MSAHNGEINTLRGNAAWMSARQSKFRSALFGGDIDKIRDVLDADGSDFDAVRQRARAAHHVRALDRARHDDDDPRGVAQQRAARRRAPRLLRVPRLAARAVGRPRGHRLHRRAAGGRLPRPQRAAPGALPGDRRRPGGHGVGGRGARHPRGADRQEVAAGSRPPAARRHRGGRDPRRRRDQAPAGRAPPVRGLDPRRHRAPRRAAPGSGDAGAGLRHAPHPPAPLRLDRRGPAPAGGADGGQRRGAGGVDGQRRPAGGAEPRARSRCSRTSSSSSRRSPTRRSTRSGRRR